MAVTECGFLSVVVYAPRLKILNITHCNIGEAAYARLESECNQRGITFDR
jgi:hypothetical protein